MLATPACDPGFLAEPAPAPATVELHLLLPPTGSPAAADVPGGMEDVPGGPVDVPGGMEDVPGALADGAGDAFERVDRMAIALRAGEGGGTLVDDVVPVQSEGGEFRVVLEVELEESVLPATLDLELLVGTAPLFRGDGHVSLRRGQTSRAEVELLPVPAGIFLSPPPGPFEALGDSLVLEGVAVFATGDTIPHAGLQWTSRDPEIVEVSSNGLAVARAEGEARVEGAMDDLSDVLVLEVSPVVVEVRLTPADAELEPGNATSIEAEILDRRGNVLAPRPLDWTSSESGVATVDSDGVVTALTPGTTEIAARYEDRRGTATISVLAVPPDVSTGEAEDLRSDGARLVGTVNPRGSPVELRFRWGTDPSLEGGQLTEPAVFEDGTDPRTIRRTLTGLRPETTYYFRAEAEGAAGSATGAVREFTTLRELPAPSDVWVGWEVDVWVEWYYPFPEVGPVTFEVQRAVVPPPFSWSTIATTADTWYVDEGLEGDVTYAYRVRACQDQNCSPYSLPDSTWVPPVPGEIAGTVRDAATGNALPGASVQLPALERGTVTSSDGTFFFGNVPSGTYTLQVSLIGYQTHSESVSVTQGQTTEVEVHLTAAPP